MAQESVLSRPNIPAIHQRLLKMLVPAIIVLALIYAGRGLPVSTTHVLSSAVAGTMVANRSGLQAITVRNILLAWSLTLPMSLAIAGGLYWLLRQV